MRKGFSEGLRRELAVDSTAKKRVLRILLGQGCLRALFLENKLFPLKVGLRWSEKARRQ